MTSEEFDPMKNDDASINNASHGPSRRGFLIGSSLSATAALFAQQLFAEQAAIAASSDVPWQTGNGTARTLQNSLNSAAAWSGFLSNSDLRWRQLPGDFYSSPFLGNGGLGISLFKAGSSKRLKIDVGHSEVRDHQGTGGSLWGNSRLPIGSFELKTAGEITAVDWRLSLWDAELTGTITTSAGTVTISSYVHAERDAFFVELSPSTGEATASWVFTPELARSPRFNVYPEQKPAGLKDNPAAQVLQTPAGGQSLQDLTTPNGHATVWTVSQQGSTKTLAVGVATGDSAAGAAATATATITGLANAGAARDSHRAWWNAFYPKSIFAVPDRRFNSFYWIQLYKLAAATRRDRPVLSTSAAWLPRVTPWPGIWWNLNVQLSYWPILATGHDELDSLTASIDRYRDNLAQNVPPGNPDSLAISRSSQENLITALVPVPGTPAPATAECGNLLWAMHNVWLGYRHSMDQAVLRDLIFPVLKKALNFYLPYLAYQSDGKLHLPRTYSPEYGSSTDTNYDLSLISWAGQTLLESADTLGIDDPLKSKWQEVRDNLVAPPQGSDGFWIGADLKLTSGHRHYSHLLWFYPLALLDVTIPANRDALLASLKTWTGYTSGLQGYTFTGSSSMYSQLGDGTKALSMLNTLADRYLQKNTMYKETGPVIETPLSAAQSLHDMALQSWGGIVRVFPAVAPAWGNLAFHDFRAQGGFVISAKRTGGVTGFVRVRAGASGTARVATSISGPLSVSRVAVSGDVLDQFPDSGRTSPIEYREIGAGVLELKLSADDDVVITPADSTGPLVLEPAPLTGSFAGWGLP